MSAPSSASVPLLPSEASASSSALPPPLQPGSAEAGLFAALRAARRDLARERRVPAFRVATDRALAWLAHWHPDSPSALLELPGWGPNLRARSGDALWSVMADAAATLGLPLQPIPPLHEGRPASQAALAAWAQMDEGAPLADIAQQIDRAPSTVYGYWLTWLQRRRPTTLRPWLSDDDWRLIAAAIDEVRVETGLRRLAPVHERLGGRYDFATLRAVALMGAPTAC